MKYLIIPFLFIAFLGFSQDETLKIVSYNLLNYPDGRDDCGANVVVPNREDTLRKIMDYIAPDIFVACEVQTQEGVDLILEHSLNHSGNNNYATADFSTNGPLNNALFYNTDKLILKEHHVIISYPRNIDHYVLYLNDPDLDVYYDTTFVEMYMTHLKAGQGTQNENARKLQAEDIMEYISNRPTDRNIFVCGDMNVYSSSDLGYTTLTSGDFALKDPVNQPGSWHNNASFAGIHTQSSRLNENYDCGAKGGMDDRFDQILVSQNVMNNTDNVLYQEGSYRAIGNDGNHFNQRLLQGTNTMYPQDLVSALYYMSDHLPVELKVDITYPNSGLALVPSVQNVSCFGESNGSATITPNLGEAPYSFLWDENTGSQTTQTAVGLEAGVYCVTVIDNLGEEDEYCITITEPEDMLFNAFVTPDNAGECQGSIQLFVSGGTSPYTYSWTDFPDYTDSYAQELCAGSYEIVVTDANGCELYINRTVGGAVGIESYQFIDESISIYPNPAKNVLNITSDFTIQELSLLSITGQRVELFVESMSQIDVSRLSNGVYFLLIKVNDIYVQKKVVIE